MSESELFTMDSIVTHWKCKCEWKKGTSLRVSEWEWENVKDFTDSKFGSKKTKTNINWNADVSERELLHRKCKRENFKCESECKSNIKLN